MSASKKPIFLALCYFLFTFGYVISTGFYHIGELSIIITTSIILAVYYFKETIVEKLNIPSSEDALVFLLTVIAIVNVAQMGARLGDDPAANWMYFSAINRVFAFGALLTVLSYFLKNPIQILEKYRFVLLLLVAIAIRIFSIVSAPNPTIDVFYILRDGPKLLLEGKNPYTLSYPAPYGVYIPEIIFIYGPLTPFIFLPSVALFNDPRFTLIVADILSAFILYKLTRKLNASKLISQLITVIFLFHPLFPFMTQRAWLEPINTLFLISSVYFLYTSPKSLLGPTFLGLTIAIKSVYLLPFFALLYNTKSRLSHFAIMLILPAVITLPFLFADSRLFLERTQSFVTNPQIISKTLAPVDISLSITAVLIKYAAYMPPTILVGILGLLATAAIIFKRAKDFSFALLSAFLIFIVLFMFGPFVFLHYYAYLGNILLLVLTFSLAKNLNDRRNS